MYYRVNYQSSFFLSYSAPIVQIGHVVLLLSLYNFSNSTFTIVLSFPIRRNITCGIGMALLNKARNLYYATSECLNYLRNQQNVMMMKLRLHQIRGILALIQSKIFCLLVSYQKETKDYITQNCNFACCTVWVRNLVPHFGEGT